MKSVGEVMAIGRTFEESLQKAIRQVDPNFFGFDAYWKPEDMHTALTENNDRRLFAIAHAMLNLNYSVEQLHDLTKIDRWFLYKLENIVEVYKMLQNTPFEQWDEATVKTAKKTGFSDLHIAQLSGKTENEVGGNFSSVRHYTDYRSELCESRLALLPSSSVSTPLLPSSRPTPTTSTPPTTPPPTILNSTNMEPWFLGPVSTVLDLPSSSIGAPSLVRELSETSERRPS